MASRWLIWPGLKTAALGSSDGPEGPENSGNALCLGGLNSSFSYAVFLSGGYRDGL
jgi:hypothetical protein